MGCFFRGETKRIKFTPTAAIGAGTLVKVGDLIGVTTSPIAANTEGEIQIDGTYELEGTTLTYTVGSVVTATVKSVAGEDVASQKVGICVKAVTSGSSVLFQLVPYLNSLTIASAAASAS